MSDTLSGIVHVWEGACSQGAPGTGIAYADSATPATQDVYTVPCPVHAEPVEHGMIMHRVMREVTCEWYAMCTNRATRLTSHPTLSYVPTCDRCADKIERIRQS